MQNFLSGWNSEGTDILNQENSEEEKNGEYEDQNVEQNPQ